MTCFEVETTAPMLLPAEDMPVGQDIDCRPYQVTENQVVEFASAWAPQYVHVDRDLAAHSNVRARPRRGLGHPRHALPSPQRAGDVVTWSIVGRRHSYRQGPRGLVGAQPGRGDERP